VRRWGRGGGRGYKEEVGIRAKRCRGNGLEGEGRGEEEVVRYDQR